MPSLFGLAPGGVCPASSVTRTAVRFYRTVSPLPRRSAAVCFLWHFPSSHLGRALSGTVPLWSPDFPREFPHAVARPSGLLALVIPGGFGKQQRKQDRAALTVNRAIVEFGTKTALKRHRRSQRISDVIAEPV
jgi:hypothetical protein